MSWKFKNPGSNIAQERKRKVSREYIVKSVYKARKYLRFMMMISLYFTRERSTLKREERETKS